MADDNWDWLEGLSGAFSGFGKGITAGMAPLQAFTNYEKDALANDRYETGNRDIEYLQQAREGEMVPDYYGQRIGADVSGYRKTQAANEYDIFGNQKKLELGQYLTDPNGLFQMQLRQEGIEPGTPEYNRRIVETIAQFDPTGMASQAAFEKLGVRKGEDRALSDQASDAMIERYIQNQTGDPNATVQRGNDGKLYVTVAGETHLLNNPGALEKAASLYSQPTPEDAINKGVNQILNINKANASIGADVSKAEAARNAIPPQIQQMLSQQQRDISQEAQQLNIAVENMKKSDAWKQAVANNDKAAQQELMQEFVPRAQAIQQRRQQYQQQMDYFTRGAGGGLRTPPGPVAPRGPSAQGGSSVNAPRPSATEQLLGTSPQPRMMPGTTAEEIDPGQANAEIFSALMGMGTPGTKPFMGPPQSASMEGGATGGWDTPVPMGSPNLPPVVSPIFDPSYPSPVQGRPPQSSSTSQMSPQQVQAYLASLAPYIQSQNRPQGGRGIDIQQLLALLQSRGMVG
jgi:hypothetical protein